MEARIGNSAAAPAPAMGKQVDTAAYEAIAIEACRLSFTKSAKAKNLWDIIRQAAMEGRVDLAAVATATEPSSGMSVVETVLKLRDCYSCKIFAEFLTPGKYSSGAFEKRHNWLATIPTEDSKGASIGIKIYESGAVYIGELRDNLRDGFGEFTRTDGGGYIGMWKQDKQHGEGRQIGSSGHALPGDSFFIDGCFHHYTNEPSTFSSLIAAFKLP